VRADEPGRQTSADHPSRPGAPTPRARRPRQTRAARAATVVRVAAARVARAGDGAGSTAGRRRHPTQDAAERSGPGGSRQEVGRRGGSPKANPRRRRGRVVGEEPRPLAALYLSRHRSRRPQHGPPRFASHPRTVRVGVRPHGPSVAVDSSQRLQHVRLTRHAPRPRGGVCSRAPDGPARPVERPQVKSVTAMRPAATSVDGGRQRSGRVRDLRTQGAPCVAGDARTAGH
jgi:hypothetical protein